MELSDEKYNIFFFFLVQFHIQTILVAIASVCSAAPSGLLAPWALTAASHAGTTLLAAPAVGPALVAGPTALLAGPSALLAGPLAAPALVAGPHAGATLVAGPAAGPTLVAGPSAGPTILRGASAGPTLLSGPAPVLGKFLNKNVNSKEAIIND